jgi:hypothetical protein
MWFIDMAYLYPATYVWAREIQHKIMGTLLQPQKCMLWCGVLDHDIVRQFFLGDKLNADCWFYIFEECLPLPGMGVNVEETLFQQDTSSTSVHKLPCWIFTVSIIMAEFCN